MNDDEAATPQASGTAGGYAEALADALRERADELGVPRDLIFPRKPPTVDETLAAIDNTTGCHQCGNPLGESPSSDFCSEYCQRVWQANRIGATAVPPEAIMEFAHGGVITNPARLHSGRDEREYLVPLRRPEDRPEYEYRAHFEIQADGSVVDNTPFIRERQRNANSTLRSFLGGEEVWWP